MSLHDTTLTPTQKWILNTNHLLLRSLRHPALQQLGQRCLDGVLHDARPLGGLNTDQRNEGGDEEVVAGGVFRSSSSQRQSAVGVNKSMNPWQWLALALASGVAAGGG